MFALMSQVHFKTQIKIKSHRLNKGARLSSRKQNMKLYIHIFSCMFGSEHTPIY